MLASVLFAGNAFAAAPLKLWHAYRGGEERAIEGAAKAFTEKTGVEVELLAVPYDGFSSKLTSTIPNDVGPDVFIFAHERLRQFARLQVVAPSELDRSAYIPAAVETLTVDGTTYGYPLALKCLALFRNLKLAPTAPTTTSQWRTELQTLSDAQVNRFGLAYESADFYYHAGFLFGFGGKLFDEQGHAHFDTPQMAASMRFVRALQDDHLMPQEASSALVKSLFNDGSAAYVISGPWFTGEIDESKISYQVSPLPIVDETGLPIAPFLGVEAAYVSSHTSQPALANQLAKFLSLGDATVLRVRQGRQIPAEIAAYDRDEVKGDAQVVAFRQIAERATPTPNSLETTRVWEPMKLALRGVLMGDTPPDQGGALAERRYKALFREAPPPRSPVPYVGAVLLLSLGLGLWQYRKRSPEPFAKKYPDARRALAFVTPAAAGIAVLVMIPFAVGVSLAFFHHDAGTYTFVGLGNFVDILSSHGYAITEPLSFYATLVVTLMWTAVNVVLHVSIGLGLALLLKSPLLRLRGLFRVILIVPWAVPNYITALMWRGLFHRQFGAINALLVWLGIEPVSWFTHFSTAFAANVATNTWLGFPFMMVVALGALQSIPTDLYEAAEVDGASRWAQFRHITLPLLRPAMLPAVTLGTVWTFNMFNVIYLVSGGEPGGATDILVSEAYRWAFQRNEQYGFAAAYAVLIFFVLFGWSNVTRRITAPHGST